MTRSKAATGLESTEIGRRRPSETISWTTRDSLLYALAIGAGHEQLAYTTENSTGTPHQVYPMFASVLSCNVGASPLASLGTIDLSQVLHGQQSVVLHRALPPEGIAQQTTVVTDIRDKGSATVVVTETVGVCEREPLYTTVATWVLRHPQGRGQATTSPEASIDVSDSPADLVRHFDTSPDQALLYRLTGDRHPLHSDPAYARKAGFKGPILHGQCTFGICGRVLLEGFCSGHGSAFRSLTCRFRSPVYPGDRVTVRAWLSDSTLATFVASVDDRVVIDHGEFAFRPENLRQSAIA